MILAESKNLRSCSSAEYYDLSPGTYMNIRVFPKIVVPQNGWFIMDIPIKMDDLGVPSFSETSI